MKYLRYTNYQEYLTLLAQGIDEDTAYANSEVTYRVSENENVETAIARYDNAYCHLALVQVFEGVAPTWMTFWTNSPEQPRYPSCWVVLRWASDPNEIDTDPLDYLDYLDLYDEHEA